MEIVEDFEKKEVKIKIKVTRVIAVYKEKGAYVWTKVCCYAALPSFSEWMGRGD